MQGDSFHTVDASAQHERDGDANCWRPAAPEMPAQAQAIGERQSMAGAGNYAEQMTRLQYSDDHVAQKYLPQDVKVVGEKPENSGLQESASRGEATVSQNGHLTDSNAVRGSYRSGESTPTATNKIEESGPIGRTTARDGATAQQRIQLSETPGYIQSMQPVEHANRETHSAEVNRMTEETNSRNAPDSSDHAESHAIAIAGRPGQAKFAGAESAAANQSHSIPQFERTVSIPQEARAQRVKEVTATGSQHCENVGADSAVVSQSHAILQSKRTVSIPLEATAQRVNDGTCTASQHSDVARNNPPQPTSNNSLLAMVGSGTEFERGVRRPVIAQPANSNSQCVKPEVGAMTADRPHLLHKTLGSMEPPSTKSTNSDKSIAGLPNQSFNQARPWSIETPADFHLGASPNSIRPAEQIDSGPRDSKSHKEPHDSQTLTTNSSNSNGSRTEKDLQPSATHRGKGEDLTLFPQEAQKQIRSWQPTAKSQSPSQTPNSQGGGSDTPNLADRKANAGNGAPKDGGWVTNRDERGLRQAPGPESRKGGIQFEGQTKEQPSKSSSKQDSQPGSGAPQSKLPDGRRATGASSDAGWITQPNKGSLQPTAIQEIGGNKSAGIANGTVDATGKNSGPKDSAASGTGHEIGSKVPAGKAASAGESSDNPGNVRRTAGGFGSRVELEPTAQRTQLGAESASSDRVCQNTVPRDTDLESHGTPLRIAAIQKSGEQTTVNVPGLVAVQTTGKILDVTGSAQTPGCNTCELPLEPGQNTAKGKPVLGDALKQVARRFLAEEDSDRAVSRSPNLRVFDFTKRTETPSSEREPALKHNSPETADRGAEPLTESFDKNEVTLMLTGFAIIDEEEEKTEPAVGNSTASVASSQPQIVTYITKDGDTLDSIALVAWGRSLVQLSPRQQQELRLKVTLIALQDKRCDASELKVLPAQRVTLAA